MQNATLLTAVVLTAAQLSFAADPGMVRLAGTPEQIGTTWGEMNRESIARDLDAAYVKRAAAAGISRETLLERSAASLRIIEEIAPHWLDEARATARAAAVGEPLYLAYLDGVVRNRFLGEDPEECTSYAVSRDHARDGAILFHKTRDNRDTPQAAYIVESSLEGINKFIAVSNATGIRCSMMVNDKGLAGAGDYPANRKKDSSTLHLEPAPDKFRGIMAGTILRHIAERASTCAEALPVRAVAFPLLMGQSRTPASVVDGTAYALGTKSSGSIKRWETLEQSIHAEKERLKEELAASVAAGNPEAAHVKMMEQWSKAQARKLVDALKQPE